MALSIHLFIKKEEFRPRPGEQIGVRKRERGETARPKGETEGRGGATSPLPLLFPGGSPIPIPSFPFALVRPDEIRSLERSSVIGRSDSWREIYIHSLPPPSCSVIGRSDRGDLYSCITTPFLYRLGKTEVCSCAPAEGRIFGIKIPDY